MGFGILFRNRHDSGFEILIHLAKHFFFWRGRVLKMKHRHFISWHFIVTYQIWITITPKSCCTFKILHLRSFEVLQLLTTPSKNNKQRDLQLWNDMFITLSQPQTATYPQPFLWSFFRSNALHSIIVFSTAPDEVQSGIRLRSERSLGFPEGQPLGGYDDPGSVNGGKWWWCFCELSGDGNSPYYTIGFLCHPHLSTIAMWFQLRSITSDKCLPIQCGSFPKRLVQQRNIHQN